MTSLFTRTQALLTTRVTSACSHNSSSLTLQQLHALLSSGTGCETGAPTTGQKSRDEARPIASGMCPAFFTALSALESYSYQEPGSKTSTTVRLPSFFEAHQELKRCSLPLPTVPIQKLPVQHQRGLRQPGAKELTVLHTWLRQAHAGQKELGQRPKARAGARKWSWQQTKRLKVHGEELGMVVSTWNPSTREAEAGGLPQVLG